MVVCEVSLIASHSTWQNIFSFSAAATSPGHCTGSPWRRCRTCWWWCRGPAQAPAASPRCPGCCWRHIALTLSHCQHSGHHTAGPHQALRAQTDSPPPTPRRGRSINIVLLNKLHWQYWHRRKNESTVSIYIYLLLPHFSIYLQYLLLRFIIFQIPSKLNRSKKPNNNNATTETFYTLV